MDSAAYVAGVGECLWESTQAERCIVDEGLADCKDPDIDGTPFVDL